LEETEEPTKDKESKKPDNAEQDQSVEKPSRFERLKRYCRKKYAKISHLVSLAHFESSPVLTDNLRSMVGETFKTIKGTFKSRKIPSLTEQLGLVNSINTQSV
jgi:hypothetical protein